MAKKKGQKRAGRRAAQRRVAWIAGAVLVVAVVGLVAALARPTQTVGWDAVEEVLGSPDAPLTIVNYLDFACPYCAIFALEIEPELVERYVETGQVRLVYRPMAFLGPGSLLAAQVGALVSDQDPELFWPFQQRVYQRLQTSGSRFTREDLVRLAAEVGADPALIEKGLDEGRYRDVLGQVRRLAIEEEGVRATPTFFVGKEKVEGLPEPGAFFALIDRLLAEAQS